MSFFVAVVQVPAAAGPTDPPWLVQSWLPEVSVDVSAARDPVVSFDGVRSRETWATEWQVGLTVRWRRPGLPDEGDTAVRAARRRLEVAEVAARLGEERARVPAGRTLVERVHAALQRAEIEARLAALVLHPNEP